MAQDLGHANDLLKAIREALQPYVSPEFATLILAAVVVLLLFKHFGAAAQIGRFFRWVTGRKDRRRAARRALFADHVESQMRRLGEKEEWRDTRYAELEAELEITGRPRRRFLRRTGLRSLQRVPSLSDALEKCEDRIVLLEGEPGAGKSVAMRHLAQRMAKKALGRSSETSVIPLYVNLKTFRPAGKPTSEDVRQFVVESVNAVRDRDVERFLDEELDRGMQEGTWLFLFDSFDEIPAILGATEANEVIVAYADAVHAFLHSMKKCRGIVASREFRGPGRSEWPTFRVVPLSSKRKKILVERAVLPTPVESLLLSELHNAEPGVQQMSSNPLFLGLLCEHMREGNEFPTSVHAVIETYISHRLSRDADRLQGHFTVGSAEVRVLAEEFAFLIADHESLGLNVQKAEAVALLTPVLGRPAEEVARTLEALIYTKIARTGDDDGTVTFSHRRLQEYFATCVVIREPSRVSAHTLLTSGRWRETAVTILQTQRLEQAMPLLTEALGLLPSEVPESTDQGIAWPPGLLYLLGILAEGGSPALREASPLIAERAGELLRGAWLEGRLFDRKWILEVCTVADTETCRRLLAEGFDSNSEWLRQESFAQMRRVPQLGDVLQQQIQDRLVDLSVGGRLRRDRRSILAQIRRMPNSDIFERTYRLMLVGPFAYLALILGVSLWYVSPIAVDSDWYFFVAYSVCMTYFYFSARLLTCPRAVLLQRFRKFLPFIEFGEATALCHAPMMAGFLVVISVLDGHSVKFMLPMLIMFSVPYMLFFFARGGRWSIGARRWPRLKFTFKFTMESLIWAGICLAGGTLLAFWPEVVKWVAMGLAILAVFASGLLGLFFSANLPLQRFRQRGTLRAFRMLLAEDAPSVSALRDILSSVRTSGLAHAIFAELNRKDAPWPDDAIAYLHEVARALETGKRHQDDLPRAQEVLSWSRSPEVLDQLSIFLGAQRKKAEATPH